MLIPFSRRGAMRPLLAGAFVCIAGSLGLALPFTHASVPSFRGSECSHFAGWESFTSAFGDLNLPDDPDSNAPVATLEQLIAGAILTSTGNIYHPFAQTAYAVEDAVPADLQEVVLQVSTQGNPRNYGSFILSYLDGNAVQQVLAPDEFVILEQTGGEEELFFRWDLSARSDEVLSYTLNFVAAAAHMSFDAVTLDARWSCEAGTGYCSGDGLDSAVTAACPCDNYGAAGHGCANSNATLGGALLTASGTTLPNTILFTGTGIPNNNLATFMRGTTTTVGGAVFGDGVRCVAGTILRFGQQLAGPAGGNADFSVAAPTADAPAGSTRYYQLHYRNPAPGFCTVAPFNISNGYILEW